MNVSNRTAKRLGFLNAAQMVSTAKTKTALGIQVNLFLDAYSKGMYATVHNPEHARHVRRKSGLSPRQFRKGLKAIKRLDLN